ncbi:MAG TPA: Hsp20/alpha crystallin family protein [Phycisphaerae bacterium]|nr:Hsp20/alpha crystallin family protein [Phycisphaerae bacterium]HRR86201.1 Hsp20/alpha crystallin family protein [Phycisphaerae bacterium]
MNLIPWRNKREARNGSRTEAPPLARLRSEMDQLFERFWRDPWSTSLADLMPAGVGVGLRLNLAESENDVTLTAELPGVDPKDVEISVSDNMLTISGEKKQEKEEKKRNYHYVERSFGSFRRSIQLPSSVDPNKVDATYRNGVLTVTLQKRPDAKPKRIAVKSG